jgi:hypothetical protein
MHQQLWGYKVEWKSVSRGTGGKRLNTTGLGYGLDDRGSRVRFPTGAGNVSLHHRVQNGPGAHPVSYPMGTRGYFPRCKADEA